MEDWLEKLLGWLLLSGKALRLAAENLQKHTTTGFKLAAKIPSIINHKIQSYFDDEGADIIPLAGQKVSEIRPETKNITSILGNEFVEDKANTIRHAKDYVTTNDTLLGDHNIPLGNISKFLGIENNKLKVGNSGEFNPDTKIIPVRNKRAVPIKEFILPGYTKALLDSLYDDREAKIDKWSHERDSIESDAMRRNNVTAPTVKLSWKLIGNSFDKFPIFAKIPMAPIMGLAGAITTPIDLLRTPGVSDVDRTFNMYPQDEAEKLTNVTKELWDSIRHDIRMKTPAYPPRINLSLPKAITTLNDTIDLDRNLGNGKLFLVGDNSYFINNLIRLSLNLADLLNADLKEHPVTPVMLDNGRYSHYMTNFPTYEMYTSGDWNRNPNDMFVIGTVK